jgi:putative addiction module component (TIGR02574 family)
MRNTTKGAVPRWARYNGDMTQQALDLLQRALSLSEEERADLACSLMESLDTGVDEGAENAWDEEISRRVTELDSGKAKTVPGEEVRRKISSRLTHGKLGSRVPRSSEPGARGGFCLVF